MARNSTLVKLFNEQSGFCAYCNEEMTLNLHKPNTSTLDHIIPRSKGGNNHIFNLVAACYECNQEKGSKPLYVFLSELNMR